MSVAYVLAGGEGRRFGGDKLIAIVEDKPSLTLIVEAIREARFNQVYIITKSLDRCKLYSSIADIDGCLYDTSEEGFEGPAAAIYTALQHAETIDVKEALIVPGDIPWITWQVFSSLRSLTPLDSSSTIIHGDGFLDSLIQFHRDKAVALALDGLRTLSSIRGYARPTDALRSTTRLVLIATLLASLSSTSFAHINTRENLRARQPKSPPLERNLLVLKPPLADNLNRPNPCKIFEQEEKYYRMHGVEHLALHARRDYETLCQNR